MAKKQKPLAVIKTEEQVYYITHLIAKRMLADSKSLKEKLEDGNRKRIYFDFYHNAYNAIREYVNGDKFNDENYYEESVKYVNSLSCSELGCGDNNG